MHKTVAEPVEALVLCLIMKISAIFSEIIIHCGIEHIPT